MTDRKPFDSTVIKEFPKIGRYRVRIVQSGRTGELGNVLDIREHMESDRYSGFTRRGIRIYDERDLRVLKETVEQILEDEMLAVPESKDPKREGV